MPDPSKLTTAAMPLTNVFLCQLLLQSIPPANYTFTWVRGGTGDSELTWGPRVIDQQLRFQSESRSQSQNFQSSCHSPDMFQPRHEHQARNGRKISHPQTKQPECHGDEAL